MKKTIIWNEHVLKEQCKTQALKVVPISHLMIIYNIFGTKVKSSFLCFCKLENA